MPPIYAYSRGGPPVGSAGHGAQPRGYRDSAAGCRNAPGGAGHETNARATVIGESGTSEKPRAAAGRRAGASAGCDTGHGGSTRRARTDSGATASTARAEVERRHVLWMGIFAPRRHPGGGHHRGRTHRVGDHRTVPHTLFLQRHLAVAPEVHERQSAEVDYVSGATQSANAFYYAVVEALSKAK